MVPEAPVPGPPQTSGHLQSLDGVRGLAILMVVCSHSFESNYQSSGFFVRSIGRLLYYGAFGVDLFFVLSGFLITGILYDSLSDRSYFRKFYARRALRIFPLYYGVLLICFLLTLPLHLRWGGMGWLLTFYLQNLRPASIVVFSPGAGIELYHFWSLAVEEQFYLVWPAIVFFVRDRRDLLRLTLACSAASLLLRLVLLSAGVSGFTVHVTTLCRADSLLLGGAVAMLYRSPHWARTTRYASIGLLAFAILIVLSTALDPLLNAHARPGLFWREGLRYSLLACGFACLVARALAPGSSTERFFRTRWLGFLGKYSYGMYVFHALIRPFLGLPFRRAVQHATGNKLAGVVLVGFGLLAISIVLAYLSYHLYERPFLRWKHHFDYKRDALNHSAPP